MKIIKSYHEFRQINEAVSDTVDMLLDKMGRVGREGMDEKEMRFLKNVRRFEEVERKGSHGIDVGVLVKIPDEAVMEVYVEFIEFLNTRVGGVDMETSALFRDYFEVLGELADGTLPLENLLSSPQMMKMVKGSKHLNTEYKDADWMPGFRDQISNIFKALTGWVNRSNSNESVSYVDAEYGDNTAAAFIGTLKLLAEILS